MEQPLCSQADQQGYGTSGQQGTSGDRYGSGTGSGTGTGTGTGTGAGTGTGGYSSGELQASWRAAWLGHFLDAWSLHQLLLRSTHVAAPHPRHCMGTKCNP